MSLFVESPNRALERKYFKHIGREKNLVFKGGFKRLADGTTVYRDYSPYKNNGVITGATWQKLSSGLDVLNFDGTDDYVDLGKPASMDFTGAFTLMCWVNCTAASQTAVISKEPTSTGGYFVRRWSDDKFYFAFFNDANTQSGQPASAVTNLGQWYFVVGTYDGTNNKLYLNAGTPVSVAAVVTPAPGTKNWYIGTREPSDTDFNGKIALLRVFSRALSAGDINGIFQTERHLFQV